jgi:hypothetical protein
MCKSLKSSVEEQKTYVYEYNMYGMVLATHSSFLPVVEIAEAVNLLPSYVYYAYSTGRFCLAKVLFFFSLSRRFFFVLR